MLLADDALTVFGMLDDGVSGLRATETAAGRPIWRLEGIKDAHAKAPPRDTAFPKAAGPVAIATCGSLHSELADRHKSEASERSCTLESEGSASLQSVGVEPSWRAVQAKKVIIGTE